MNADGTAGVRVETQLGVDTDLVLWLGIAALAAGGAPGRARAPPSSCPAAGAGPRGGP